MTDYIHHTGGIVDINAAELPTAWKNISGINNLSTEELKNIGWLPVNYVNKTYDAATQVRTGPAGGQLGDNVSGDIVDITYTVTNKTASEIDAEKDVVVESILQNVVVAAVVSALNDGTFIPGSNYTEAQLAALIKGKV
jgi:hypothetical protein